MSLDLWQEQRRDLQTRRRRAPEQTLLYRAVYQERENLERVWEERYQKELVFFRPVVKKTLDCYLNCGVLAYGCACIKCQQCGHIEVLGFSCKTRGFCESCGAKRAVKLGEHSAGEARQPKYRI